MSRQENESEDRDVVIDGPQPAEDQPWKWEGKSNEVRTAEPTRNDKIKKMIGVIVIVVLGLVGSGGTAWWATTEDKPETIREAQQALRNERKELRVSIVAPREATAGDLIEFHANVSYGNGEPTEGVTYAWSIVPPPSDGLKWRSDEPEALFANRDAGEYILYCSVSGPNGELAQAWKSLTLLPNTVEVEVPYPVEIPIQQQQAPPTEGEATTEVPHVEPQKIQLADTGMTDFTIAVENLAVQIQSPTILDDAKKVASAFRTASTATLTGQLNGKEPFDYAVEYASTQLGDATAAWKPFFDGVKTLLGALTVLGVVQDQETVALALADAATTLENAGPY